MVSKITKFDQTPPIKGFNTIGEMHPSDDGTTTKKKYKIYKTENAIWDGRDVTEEGVEGRR